MLLRKRHFSPFRTSLESWSTPRAFATTLCTARTNPLRLMVFVRETVTKTKSFAIRLECLVTKNNNKSWTRYSLATSLTHLTANGTVPERIQYRRCDARFECDNAHRGATHGVLHSRRPTLLWATSSGAPLVEPLNHLSTFLASMFLDRRRRIDTPMLSALILGRSVMTMIRVNCEPTRDPFLPSPEWNCHGVDWRWSFFHGLRCYLFINFLETLLVINLKNYSRTHNIHRIFVTLFPTIKHGNSFCIPLDLYHWHPNRPEGFDKQCRLQECNKSCHQSGLLRRPNMESNRPALHCLYSKPY